MGSPPGQPMRSRCGICSENPLASSEPGLKGVPCVPPAGKTRRVLTPPAAPCPAETQTPGHKICREIREKELTNLGARVYSWEKRGSLCGRLRGSSQTSTLEPDAGNAAVGSQGMIFFGGTIRCLRFLLCRCTNAQADGREDVSAVPRRARRAGGSALGPMRAMGSRVPA